MEKRTSFTIPTTKPTNTNGCKYFLGWSTNKNATSAQYTAGQQKVEFKTNTTLYAVWENHHDGDGDKVCDLCQTALTAPTTVNGVYQISNKNQLIWFMQYVNAGNKGANAVLTADIDMGGYNWTPIASTASYHESGAAVTDKGYTGTFDGAGHVIKNFTVSGGAGDGSSSASGNVKSYGLFGTVSGTVKNLGIDGYTFHVGTADCRAGGIVGQLVTGGRIENCYVINSKVLTGSYIAGAIAGCNYGGTIDSCFAYNCEVTGHSRCAAIVGDTKDDGGSKIGTVINCYADKNPVGSQNGGSGYVQNCATLTAAQIASGEAAWKLNGNTTDGVWKQTIGTGLPNFSSDTVYQVLRCDGKTITYSNSNVSPQAHTYGSDNLCTFCGTLNPDAVASVSKNGVVTGAYTTLNDAIEAVKDCTADDKAVITLLKDIELGSGYQTINGGIFTIDLNGKTLSNTDATWATLTVINAKLTITDSGSGGAIYSEKRWALEACDSAVLTVNRGDIYGKKDGIHATAGSIVTVNGGSISGDSYGVYADISSQVTIAGGSVSSSYYGANAVVNGKLVITGGTVTGDVGGVYTTSSQTVAILGGTISGDEVGICMGSGSAVEIFGGSISCGQYDIKALGSVRVELFSATFPGGIAVQYTTLNAILGYGAAYWQGDTMIIPADDADFILGGDVTVKDACQHPSSKTYTNNGNDHTYTYPCCNATVTEGHSYTNGLCVCGAVSPDAVATVIKDGIVIGAYTTLNDALQVVKDCTADDKAVVTILQNIVLGDSYQEISSGVFAIDLNGYEISSTESTHGALYIKGGTTEVMIWGAGDNSKITGADTGVQVDGAKLTVIGGTIRGGSYGLFAKSSVIAINGGTISAELRALECDDCDLTITDGTISGYDGMTTYNSIVTISGGSISGDDAVRAFGSNVTISGGTVTGGNNGLITDNSDVTISGGSISCDYCDINTKASKITLILSDKGVGATFPGGIQVTGTNLNEILGEFASYWQGSTMIIPADGATEITGGDVVMNAICHHWESKPNYTDLKDGVSHSYVCSDCNNTFTEVHSYDATTLLCVCGAAHSDAVASVSKNGIATGAYTTLNDAIQAVANCAADDEAVITILQDIALGKGYQSITSGVFTIDLNGFEISSTSYTAPLYISGSTTNVTIQGSGENSKITGYYGVYADSNSSVTISGGTISGGNSGVNASNSTVTITDGAISGEYGVYANTECTVTISGGTISGDIIGVMSYATSTATISGGTIRGDSEGVLADGSTVNISGGSISGGNYGVQAYSNSTVEISGGTISSDQFGVYVYDRSTLTVSGGRISSNTCDIYYSGSTAKLTLGENGVGATFPGGIKVAGITLNAILGEGVAYWQGNTMILPADDAKEITGGDVVIKAECKHTNVSFTYTNNGADHSYTYSCCNATVTEPHSYTNGLCVCGAVNPDAVATVSKNGIATGAYTTLNDAIQAVANCTADDEAVITILQNIALGDSRQRIDSGVFTIDLNGFEISGTNSYWGVFAINGAATNVTIQGTGENSRITGDKICIEMDDNATLIITGGTISGGTTGVHAVSSSTVTVSGGSISADIYGVLSENSTVTVTDGTISGGIIGGGPNEGNIGVYAMDSTVTISGGTISGTVYGMDAVGCTVTISGGAIKGGYSALNARSCGTVTISGGSISGDGCDIVGEQSTITLTLGEDGVGATFPGGIYVYGTTLNAILGEGIAYWQGDTMILLAENAGRITDGDVTIKAECKHTNVSFTYTNNGADHSYTYSCCNARVTEPHSYTNGVCVCGSEPAVSVTIDGNATYYPTLNDAIQAVKNCTADDKAVVTILQNIALGNSYQKITSGVFTIDLNGHEISCENAYRGALYLSGAGVNVTIQGAGENSKIIGAQTGVELVNVATLTIISGTISGGNIGVYAFGRTVTISGGSISGDNCDIYIQSSIIALTLGENGVGATFPGGITLYGTTLNAILGEGAAYWQNGKQLTVADDADEITGGDVTIKAGCVHSWQDATCTAPKTCSKCGATEGEPTGLHIDENNNGRCDTCNCLMQPAKLVMATMSLEGNIGINYYMLLSDDVINDPTAFMQFTLVDGEVINVPVSEGIPTQVGDEILYLFTCAVNAKEMSDDVLAQCFYEGGSTQVYTYSVMAYCDHILNSSDNEALKDLVKKMLHYGAASQNYFQYNTDDLANAGLEAPNYEGIVIDGFKATAGQGTELSKLYAVSLILKSETTLRFFFDGPITATYNGQALNVGQRSGLYYVDVTGIAAADLDEDIVITVNDGTNTADIVFNPMAYCQGVYNNSDDVQLVELVTALYVYNQAANNYFEEV